MTTPQNKIASASAGWRFSVSHSRLTSPARHGSILVGRPHRTMKLIEHLRAIEQFVLGHKPPPEIRTRLDVLQQHLEMEDNLLDRIAKNDADRAAVMKELNTKIATLEAKIKESEVRPLEDTTRKALKHFSDGNQVLTPAEVASVLGCAEGAAQHHIGLLVAQGFVVSEMIPIPQRWSRGAPTCGYVITPKGRKYVVRTAA